MILVTATLNLKPGSQMALRELTIALIAHSRLDPGCFGYDLYTQVDQPNVFLLLEEWQDLNSLENHFQQPHFKTFAREAGKFLTSNPLIRQFRTLSE
ncbi:putative quinol monooxygenase [Spirosoma lituiforme]